MKPIIIAGVLILLAAAGLLLCRGGQARVGTLTNVDGVPYPVDNGRVVITEKLAHADLYVNRPLFGKQVTLTVSYMPLMQDEISVGVRENSFWLSYPRQPLHRQEAGQAAARRGASVTSTVTIPLTDKLPDRDGSLDVMFFAGPEAVPENNPVDDTTRWYIANISAQTSPMVPTVAEAKDYLRRLLTREVPL